MDAQTYRKTVGDTGITPEIQALADEITAGLTNDFDKAEALESGSATMASYTIFPTLRRSIPRTISCLKASAEYAATTPPR